MKAQARERRSHALHAWMVGATVGMNKPPDFKRWMRAWDPAAPVQARPMNTDELEGFFDGLVRSTSRRS